MSNTFNIGDLASMGLPNIGLGPLNMGSMLDTAEFVRKAWSSFGVPSNFAPTVDLQELDRRISDLKAVEQWLTVNMNMLKGSIQALEIQRGTIATLQAFGSALATPAAAASASAAAAMASAASSASSAAPVDGGASGTSTRETAATAPAAEPAAPRDEPAAAPAGQPASGGAAGANEPADPALSPSAWWNMLQSQFNQVAAAALSGVGLPSAALSGMPGTSAEPAPTAGKRATKSSARPAAKSSAKGAAKNGAKNGAKERSDTSRKR